MQLSLAADDTARLINRIEEDYQGALADHSARMERNVRYWRLWRNRVDPLKLGDEGKSNYRDPLMQSQVMAKWARDMQALLGDDAEIIADPTGPSDQRTAEKVGAYMSWRLFSSMDIVEDLAVFDFRRVVFGRSHAWAPWIRETFETSQTVPADPETGTEEKTVSKEEVWYEGPGFVPLWPDDLVLPAMRGAKSIHDFPWKIRKYTAKPDDFVKGERDGYYIGITGPDGLIEAIRKLAEENYSTAEPLGGDDLQREADDSEGVTRDYAQSRGCDVKVHEWYGRIRPPGAPPEAPDQEVVVAFLPDLHKIVGVRDLKAMYPRLKDRAPFVESSLIKDGSYWSPGYGEWLEMQSAELTANHNQFTDAGRFSAIPTGFYSAAAGMPNKPIRLEPGVLNPVADPKAIAWMKSDYDPTYFTIKDQAVRANAERVTSQTDQTLGRAIDRPNAPKTASGQAMLIEEGNLVNSFSTIFLKNDLGKMLSHFWMLECMFAPSEVFFRVTEQDASGALDSFKGFGRMTSAEFGGRYDFRVKFATTVYAREARKERALTLYQLSLQNPLIAGNPKALYNVTRDVFEAMGVEDFSDIVPEPPEMENPKNPRVEWTMALQGEDIKVHPQDNDDLHIQDHTKRAMENASSPNADEDASNRMFAHIADHEKQRMAKQVMQQQIDRATAQIGPGGMMALAQGGIPQMGAPQPGGMPGMPPQQPEETGGLPQ